MFTVSVELSIDSEKPKVIFVPSETFVEPSAGYKKANLGSSVSTVKEVTLRSSLAFPAESITRRMQFL